jgi:hypothetical protein
VEYTQPLGVVAGPSAVTVEPAGTTTWTEPRLLLLLAATAKPRVKAVESAAVTFVGLIDAV